MKYFTLKELCNSATAKNLGINNNPTTEVARNLTLLVEKILDPIREKYGKPVIVTSGYRCPALNKAVGGSNSSQHVYGQAVDIRSVSDTLQDNMKLLEVIKGMNLPYDQLIFEYGRKSKGPDWIHVSYSPKMRRQYLEIGVQP